MVWNENLLKLLEVDVIKGNGHLCRDEHQCYLHPVDWVLILDMAIDRPMQVTKNRHLLSHLHLTLLLFLLVVLRNQKVFYL